MTINKLKKLLKLNLTNWEKLEVYKQMYYIYGKYNTQFTYTHQHILKYGTDILEELDNKIRQIEKELKIPFEATFYNHNSNEYSIYWQDKQVSLLKENK